MPTISEPQVSCPMCSGEGNYLDSFYPYAANPCPMCMEFGKCPKSWADEYIAQEKENKKAQRRNRQRYR
jgi:hypothetical protein